MPRSEQEQKRMKYVLVLASMMAVLSSAWAQTSPPETATGKIGSATLVIKYCAPSVRGRQIFGEGGRVMQDPTAPIWRAGANDATAFHTDADLNIGGLAVPKGDYTLYVNVKDPECLGAGDQQADRAVGHEVRCFPRPGPGEDGNAHASRSH